MTSFKSRIQVMYLKLFQQFAQRNDFKCDVQGDSVARGPKLLSIVNYVIEIMP